MVITRPRLLQMIALGLFTVVITFPIDPDLPWPYLTHEAQQVQQALRDQHPVKVADEDTENLHVVSEEETPFAAAAVHRPGMKKLKVVAEVPSEEEVEEEPAASHYMMRDTRVIRRIMNNDEADRR